MGPHRLEHPRIQRVGVGREDPDHLVWPEHPVHHGHLQQAGGEERHPDGRRHFFLEQGEKSAGGRDGTAPRRLQFLRRLDEWLEERGILLVHDPLGRGAVHDAEPDREIERGGVADITRDAREDRVQGEDTHRLAIITSTAFDDWHDCSCLRCAGQDRRRGSRMSRNPSPSRLKPSVTSMMARPGNSTTWGLVDRYDRPFASMAPHSGMGGWTPRPRKLWLEARRSAVAIRRLACTNSGDMTLGSTCRTRRWTSVAPCEIPACTNSTGRRLRA